MSGFLSLSLQKLLTVSAIGLFSFMVPLAHGCGIFCHDYFWNSVTPELMEEWLEKTPKATTSKSASGYFPVHYAALKGRNAEALTVFLKAGADPNAKTPNGLTPLFFAVQVNPDPAIAKAFLDGGADANAKDADDNTPIFYIKDEEMVKILGEAGADLTIRNSSGAEPLLYFVLLKKDASIIQAVLDAGADPESQYSNKLKVLHYAIIKESDADTIKALAQKADLNSLDGNDKAPLHYAAEVRSSKEVVLALLEGGADVNVKNKLGVTPMCIAEIHHREIVKLLKKWGGKC